MSKAWTPGSVVARGGGTEAVAVRRVPAIVHRGGRQVSVASEKLSTSQYAQLFESGQEAMWGASGRDLGGPRDPMRQSLWYSVCVNEIATNASQVPIRLSRRDATGTRAWGTLKHIRTGRDRGRKVCRHKAAQYRAAEGEIVEGGDLYELLERPNPEQTWPQFVAQTVGLLYVHGRVHWLYDDMQGRRPLTMYAIPGSRTQPITDDAGKVKKLLGWSLKLPNGNREAITLDECLTFQLFDPEDRHRGISPREPGRLAIVSDYNASLYNAAQFGNSAEPGVVLKTDAPYDPEADEQMRTAWNQRHRGAARAKALAILWGGLDVDTVASTMSEMVWPEGKRLSREEICAVCRVPPSIAGFLGTTGDSSAYTDHEEKRFWGGTMFPLLNQIAEGVETHLVPAFGVALSAWFDVEHMPVVAKMRLAVMPAVEGFWSKGVPLMDLSDLFDLGLPEQPQHLIGWLPLSIQTASDAISGIGGEPPLNEGPSAPGNDALDQPTGDQTSEENPPDAPDDQAGRGKSSPSVPAMKADVYERIWKAWYRSWQPLARSFRNWLRGHYGRQERAVKEALKKHVSPQRSRGTQREEADASGNSSSVPPVSSAVKDAAEDIAGRVLFDVFGDRRAREESRLKVRAFLADAERLGVSQALAEGGMAAESAEAATRLLLSNPEITRQLQSEAVKISTLIDDASRKILRRHLVEGLNAGETALQLADRVQDVMGNRRKAALTVARNSIGQTLSMARHEGHKAAGMTHKIWVFSRGPGERREAHVLAESTYRRSPIPLAEPFVINGVPLMFPRDFSSGHPEETVNCQCLQIAKRMPAAGRGPTSDEIARDYAALRFVAWDDLAGTPAQPEEDDDEQA